MLRPFDVVEAVGKRGSGKSSRVKKLLATEPRALVFDPQDEYSRHAAPKPTVEAGPLRDRCTVEELFAHPEWLRRRDLSLACVPESKDSQDMADDLRDVLGLVRETRGGFVFALDEVGHYRDHAEQAINELATQSRHYGAGVPVVLVAQRAVQIPKTAREQVSVLYCGQQTSPDDLAALEKLVRSTLGKDEAAAFVAKVAKQKRPGILEWRDDS